MSDHRYRDVSGQKFGLLTAVEPCGRDKFGNVKWLCKCDCGNETTAVLGTLVHGSKKSCGCLFKRYYTENKRLYNVWRGMINRCENENTSSYHLYGKRGIKVCDEWHVFKSFLDWSMNNGYDQNAPRGKCTLDRIDVNGDYCPENCRWVDMKTQGKNFRKNHRYNINGEELLLEEAANKYGISKHTIKSRLRYGWDVERAVTTPPLIDRSNQRKRSNSPLP